MARGTLRRRAGAWRLLLVALVAIGLQGLAAPARAQTAPPPDFVMCPQVPGYDATFEYQTQVSFDAATGGYRVNCWYMSTQLDDGGATVQSELILDASWAPPDDDENVTQWLPDGVTGVMITYCSDIDEFTAGIGITASGDRSVRSTYKFREAAKPHDPAVGADAAKALRAVVEQYARSCEGVEIIPRSAYFTPLPAYLVEALEASASSPPADPTPVTAAPTAPPETTAPTDAPTPADAAAPPQSPDTPTEEGSKGLQAIGFVLLGLSVLGLLWTLKKAGKERRVRPRFDVLRVLIITGTAIGTMIILANTPIWAVAGGAGLGVLLGWAQGRNVAVRVDGKRAYEKRQVIAIVAFAVGLVVSQGAGLLNRTGVIGIGVGVTFLSAATAAGLIAGRRKPLRAARATGVASVLIGGLLLASFLPLVAVAVAQEQPSDEERRTVVLDDLTAAVSWDQVEVTGGLFAFEGKPLAVLPISPGLTEPPAPLTRTVEWVWVPPGSDPAFGTSFSVTETFSFSLNADGICCTVSYEGEGIDTRGGGESVVTASGTIGDYVGFADQAHTSFDEPRGSTWGIPFGAPEQIQVGDSEPVCRRPVASAQRGGSTDWEATWNGEPAPGTGQSFGMYTGCDIAGFDVPTAQAALPPVPVASASERDVPGTATGGGCPVFQESFNALYDESMGSAATDQIRRLMVNPNSSACSSFVSIGDEGPGGVRSEIDYDLATPDPGSEMRRLYDAYEDLLRTIAPHELAQKCAFDDRGVALPPPPGERCEVHTFHEVAGLGRIRIFTDYASDDGPNVIIQGFFPWGSYRYRCHHCDANSPEVPRIVAAMDVLGNTGLGGFGPEAEVVGSVGAPEDRVGDATNTGVTVDEDMIDLLADDPSDPFERAAIAAAIGLLGTIGFGGVTLLEERLGRKEEEAPPVAQQEAPLPADEELVDADKTVRIFDPELGHGVWLTPEEAEERLDELRGKEVERHDTEAKTNLERSQTKQSQITKEQQAEAAERMRKRAEEEARWAEWEERIKSRDGLERRQDLLEADSARKNSWADWTWDVLGDMSRGAQEDVLSLWPDVKDAIVSGILWTADELTDSENWTVLGETVRDTVWDSVLIALNDPSTKQRVSDNLEAGLETASRVAATLWEQASKDKAGAAVGVVKILVGFENWEKVVDGDRTLAERLARVMWGAVETGTALWGAGSTAVKVADKIADLARGAGAVSDAARVARQAEALLDAAKAADRATDAALAADRTADAARAADQTADAARAAAEAERIAMAEARIALRDAARRDAWVRNLPEGAVIELNWLHEVGYSQRQIDELARLASRHKIQIGSRSTNMDSMQWIRRGEALPKPLDIKAKTINKLDTYLGASPADEGLVGYFRPQQPDYSKIPDEFHAIVRKRYDDRLTEYNSLRSDVTRMITEGKVIEKEGKLFAVASDGRHVPYTGDIDLVFLRNADGSHLTAEKYARVLDEMKASGAQIQHGAETDVINFFTEGLTVGSPEWSKAYDKAMDLVYSLEEAHVTGREIIVTMGPDGVLRRGGSLTRLDQVRRL